MVEEIALNQSPQKDAPVVKSIESIQETMGKFLETASVNAVYGEPIQNGQTLIIPAAEIVSGFGFGMGYGSGSDEGSNDNAGGGGGGGGGRIFSRPVALIIADNEHVRIEPVLDVTKIALAALTAAGFIFGMIGRMSSAKKALPKG